MREKLDRDRLDPVHGFFSESGTHPRFAGLNLSGGMVADAGGTALDEARFVMGSLWPEHPATLTVWPLAFHLAVQATAHASALAPFMENDGADRICAQAVVDCIHETKEGIRLVMAELGEPDTDHVGAYDELQALVTGRVAGAD